WERAEGEVPKQHIRVNQITAIGNEGEIHFMNYRTMNWAVFLVFLYGLVECSRRKILLIVDRLQSHLTPEVDEWLEKNKGKIEVFYLPSYSPQLNPVEFLNNDLKGRLNKAGMPEDKGGLRQRLLEAMDYLSSIPSRVINFFLHPDVQYAAPVELLTAE